MSEKQPDYLALWQRMNAVVQAYSDKGRTEEADYCMVDFFINFDDPEELAAHVAIAEEAAREAGVFV